jgi:hypothetical protein
VEADPRRRDLLTPRPLRAGRSDVTQQLDARFELDLVAHDDAADVEVLVPVQAERLPVELAARDEDATRAPGLRARAAIFDRELDGSRDAPNARLAAYDLVQSRWIAATISLVSVGSRRDASAAWSARSCFATDHSLPNGAHVSRGRCLARQWQGLKREGRTCSGVQVGHPESCVLTYVP